LMKIAVVRFARCFGRCKTTKSTMIAHTSPAELNSADASEGMRYRFASLIASLILAPFFGRPLSKYEA
jgi:hypothetical protein